MNTNPAGLRALTDAEAYAVELVGQDEPIDSIESVTGLTRAQIAAAVDQAALLADPPAAPPAPAVSAPLPVTALRPQALARSAQVAHRLQSSPAATDVAGWSIDQLLEWADEDGGTKARSLAARLRLIARDLRTVAGQGEAVRKAEAKISKLEAQLKAAKEERRLAMSSRPAPAAPAAPAASAEAAPTANLAQIRAWAAGNGLECPSRGRIPGHVRKAYDAAAAGPEAAAGGAR